MRPDLILPNTHMAMGIDPATVPAPQPQPPPVPLNLHRGIFVSVPALTASIQAYIEAHNADPRPYV